MLYEVITGGLAELKQSALKLALHCKAPIYILCLKNTNALFIPGRFVFATRKGHDISLRIVERIDPEQEQISVASLADRVKQSVLVAMQEAE